MYPLHGAGDALPLAHSSARAGDTDPHRESSRIREAKLFDATLALRRAPLSRKGLVALLARWPWMTMKVLLGIYWQALRLFIKRTPIFSHPESR